MFQRDYILRIVEMFAKAVARILQLKEQKEYAQALQEIGEAYRSLFGIPPDLVRDVSAQELMVMLNRGEQPDRRKYGLMAELMKEEADLLRVQGKPDPSVYAKALFFYFEALHSGEGNSQAGQYASAVDAILEALSSFELSAELRRRIFSYFEATGRYAEAENILFEMAEGNDPELLQLGDSFYERLRTRSPEDLTRGNLPLDELEEGWRSFHDRIKDRNRSSPG